MNENKESWLILEEELQAMIHDFVFDIKRRKIAKRMPEFENFSNKQQQEIIDFTDI